MKMGQVGDEVELRRGRVPGTVTDHHSRKERNTWWRMVEMEGVTLTNTTAASKLILSQDDAVDVFFFLLVAVGEEEEGSNTQAPIRMRVINLWRLES